MSMALAAMAVLIPLGLYLWAGLGVKPAKSYHQFFNARQAVSSSEFANSSIAYGFQIATISVFLAWGYLHPLPALVNTVCLGIGIFLLARLAPKFIPYIESSRTLHGFIGDRYNSPWLRTIAATMTVIGFVGLLLAELIWGSQVFAAYSSNESFMYAVTFGMGIFVLVYFIRGGQLSVIRTDQYQLVFSYAGLLATILWIVAMHLTDDSSAARAAGLLIAAVFSLLLLLVLVGVRRTARQNISGSRHNSAIQVILEVVLLLGAILFMLEALLNYRSVASIGDAVSQMQWRKPGVDGWSFLSLILLPLGWQFVDFTIWQRIGAIQLQSDEQGRYDIAPVRRGLIRYAVESPVTWCVALGLGILLRFTDLHFDDESIWNAMKEIPEQLQPAGFGGALVAAMFVLGIVACMLSTFDSSLVGSVTAFVYDVLPGTRKAIDDEDRTDATFRRVIRIGVLTGSGFVIVGLIAYYVCSAIGFPILSLLFGAYAVQISFAPTVIGMLVLGDWTPSARWAIVSTVFGILLGMYATMVSLQDTSWALYPPLFALAGSVPVYVIGTICVGVRGKE